MYNFRVVSHDGKQQTEFNFKAKSYRRKSSKERDELEIFHIQDSVDDLGSTMVVDFMSDRDKGTSVYVMNEAGKTIDSLNSHSA